jgi:hypothetical protein
VIAGRVQRDAIGLERLLTRDLQLLLAIGAELLTLGHPRLLASRTGLLLGGAGLFASRTSLLLLGRTGLSLLAVRLNRPLLGHRSMCMLRSLRRDPLLMLRASEFRVTAAVRLHRERRAAAVRLHDESMAAAAATVTVAAAARRLHYESVAAATAMAATATAAGGLHSGPVAFATAAMASAAAVGACTCRGCDRQRGNAGCEKDPGHDIISSRTSKTARSTRRSNTLTDGTGALAH